MPGKRLTDAQRKGIQAALLANVGVNEAARLYGASPSSVSSIARAMGHDVVHAAAKRANSAGALYSKAERLHLSNELFDQIRIWMQRLDAPSDLKDLVMSFAILTDKRRLEEGEATERREYNDPSAIVARGRDRLESLRRAS